LEQTILVTGIGTGIGKTVVAAILAEAMMADYWKPVQAGYENATDSEWLKSVISNSKTRIYPETYRLKLAASPHIAAREEGIVISLGKIFDHYLQLTSPGQSTGQDGSPLIIEGAGGILVPLTESEFVIDLIKKLNVKVILVSRNYLGSINHSLLTAQVCRRHNIPVVGWIFNDQYLDYEDEIVRWSGFPKLASVNNFDTINKEVIHNEAMRLKEQLLHSLS